MANNKQKKPQNDNFFNKNPLLTFAIFSVILILLFKSILQPANNMGQGAMQHMAGAPIQKTKEISYSELKKLIKEGRVQYVAIGQKTIKAIANEGGFKVIYFANKVPGDTTLIPLLEKKGIDYGGFSESNWVTEMLFGWIIPILIFFAIWMFLASRMQKSMGSGILGMGSAKKLINSERPKVKFDDVAGVEEAKEEVKEIVDFLKHPQRYIRLGAKIPKGVLLVGPPGTGKTLLAKAVAGEADVPFFAVSGSSFIEMFVGVGAARVRDLFEQAKKEAPSIIFIDEIDAIGKSRAAAGPIGGNDEREQTLNQLLAEMDGFDSSESPVIVLAATNRPEVLDPALLRPGRFDRTVVVDKPDFEGRLAILKVHVKHIKLSPNVDLEEIARLTAGLAGADLANIVNEAALLAGRKNKEQVEQEDLLEAVERAIAGLEKKSRRISPEEKRIVAYHESGHALIAETTPGARKVTKVSIIPRGLAALGYTLNTPEENKYLMKKSELVAEIDTLLGGRAAEEIFIGEITTGASNDLERATDIVKAMISMYGMSDVAGLMVLEKRQNLFLGGPAQPVKEYSEKLAEEIDEFIKAFLNDRYTHVKNRLQEYSEAIEKMVKVLFEKEVIEGKEVRQIIKEFEEKHGKKSLLVEELQSDIEQAKHLSEQKSESE
ncbi:MULTISPECIES: ATP-dependent zinc metalloprotease FtsH [unclassified Nitratiruptor]|uniref:ATP-dependent zinc metalloprotease FtsH n=1 Tax=unclassified Nitratiruptor TaxID=2624044 RepID=UPI0019374A22|nr:MULTISPECIES: ATP-dependent zinc metalloprotease FtsH [unclassified Nitratiruptor]BCD60716.1 cell division protease FtsH [Nitratiruptor sp. YY08-10]BCD64648.1 cell division protease FtsH [Nitratiruptor sp. YY08-14]